MPAATSAAVAGFVAEDTAGSFSSLDITSIRGMMFDDTAEPPSPSDLPPKSRGVNAAVNSRQESSRMNWAPVSGA